MASKYCRKAPACSMLSSENDTTMSYTGGSTILKWARAAASLSFTRERLLTTILRNMSLA